MNWVGIGYREQLAGWVRQRPPEIECLEITAEHFFEGDHDTLHQLCRDYPVFVHGLGLSLGTPGPLDKSTLQAFAEIVDIAQPHWISEHIAFTRSQEVDLGHLNPIRPTKAMVDLVAEHAAQVAETCQRPIILENITSHLRMSGDLSEPEFLNQVCDRAGCGLLLDVTNLFINARNHGFDAIDWLHEIEPKRIVQLHVVGYTEQDGQLHDYHSEPIQPDLMALITAVLDYSPVQAITLERDVDFPPASELANELQRLRQLLDRHSPLADNEAAP